MRAITYLRLACASLAVVAAGFTTADLRSVPATSPAMENADLADTMDRVLDDAMREYTIAGVVAGVIRDGEVVWSAREGVATADGRPVTGDTSFNLGSISKPLTVWLVLDLAEAGLIDLDTPVSQYLTRFALPAGSHDAGKVTVRRLLRHTAGTNLIGYGGYGAHEEQPADVIELSTTFEPLGLVREPATTRSYSGGGYVLLQMMIEDITGGTLEAAAHARLFAPMEMHNSGFAPELLPHRADAFNYYRQPIESLRDVALTAAGGWASGDDIERFLLAHFDGGGVLGSESLAAAFAPTVPDPGYAMSYTRWQTPRGNLLGHGGNNSTWHGQIYVRPETGDAFYFLTNATSGAQLDLDLSCAWLPLMESEAGVTRCASVLGTARSVAWWSLGLGWLAIGSAWWLGGGMLTGRRALSLRPTGHGPIRLTGRLAGFALMLAMLVFSIWVSWTNSVIWRTETILIDEIPLDELEGLTLVVSGLLTVWTLCLWSNPVRSARQPSQG
ncbi:serine hydrolase domain-containing protein [Maricaulis sp.]|uniref:serine hydrolase domain-containing protein n=1 Tax=Maricaulis sp. TaxID=1486257 RepID=UPI002B27994E|nr:serine hydrolase domain-containing protein [Maricaulis sp.]